MKILFLSHRIPYPPNKGDKIRSFNEIKFLSERHCIDLACLADDPDDLKYEADLQKYCSRVFVQHLNKNFSKIKGLLSFIAGQSISAGYFWHKRLQLVVSQWLSETHYDATICFSSPMAEYVFRSGFFSPHSFPAFQPPSGNTLLIIDFCDVDSDKWRQYAKRSKFPMNIIYNLEGDRLLAYEKEVNQSFDHSIFATQSEAEYFSQLYPSAKNVHVIQNGVDTDYFCPNFVSHAQSDPKNESSASQRQPSALCLAPCALSRAPSSSIPEPCALRREPTSVPREPSAVSQQHPVLLFTGAMDYHANIDAVTWFHNEVLPEIKKEFQGVQFFIVGSNPESSIRKLASHIGTTVTGFVDDIRPFYQLADISIIPLRMGRGIQNKLLEAMAMEMPVVATPKATEGLWQATQTQISIADNPSDFAEKVCNLLRDRSLRAQIGKKARVFVKKNFDWNINMTQFELIILSGRGKIPN
jgi:glycosyltransferase involved in cell wall biosynthesis